MQEIKKDIEIIFFVEKFTKCGRRCRDEGREVSCRDEGRDKGRGLTCGTLCRLFGGLRKRLNGL